MPVLSKELSISPNGELTLGLHAVFGEIHDLDSGEELFIPQKGFKICGLCDADSREKAVLSIMCRDWAWLSQD
jgi:hypothetical protein